MPKIVTMREIKCAPDVVYALLVDFANYHQWLGTSETFQTVQNITENPVQAGTTYTDNGAQLVMYGKVSLCEPSQRLTFQQIGNAKIVIPLGTIDITIDYELTPTETGTRLVRNQTVKLSGLLLLLQPRLMSIMQRENNRILDTLCQHLEAV